MIALFYLYAFFKKNIYNTIVYQLDTSSSAPILNKDSINIERFNKIISIIEEKQKTKNIQNINNIFY